VLPSIRTVVPPPSKTSGLDSAPPGSAPASAGALPEISMRASLPSTFAAQIALRALHTIWPPGALGAEDASAGAIRAAAPAAASPRRSSDRARWRERIARA